MNINLINALVSKLHEMSDYSVSSFAKRLAKLKDPQMIKEALDKTVMRDHLANVELLELKLSDASFIKRQLRKIRGYQREMIAYKNKEVGKSGEILYVSQSIRDSHEYHAEMNEIYMQNASIFVRQSSGLYKEVKMSVVAKTAEMKLAEIYTDSLAIETMCEELEYQCAMATITAPARFHSNPSVGKCKWDGSSSRDAYKFINEAWRKAYKLIKKWSDIAGLKAVEVHKDGCPHIHVAIFFPKNDRATIEEKFANSMEKSGINEKGWDLSFTEDCDDNVKPQKASSYIFKYVRKSLMGEDGYQAWFGVDNGGIVRRFATFGTSSHKGLFSYLYKNRKKIEKSGGVFVDIAELMNNEEMHVSMMKLKFIQEYAQQLKVHYKETVTKYGEIAKGGIDYVTTDNEEVFKSDAKAYTEDQVKAMRDYKTITDEKGEELLDLDNVEKSVTLILSSSSAVPSVPAGSAIQAEEPTGDEKDVALAIDFRDLDEVDRLIHIDVSHSVTQNVTQDDDKQSQRRVSH